MTAFRLLNLRRMREQPFRFVVAFLSVVAGVSLASSVFVVRDSFVRTIDDYERSFGGAAPLRVVGPATRGGLAASVLPRVEAVEGVRAAVPLVQAITSVDDARGEPRTVVAIGFDCRIRAVVGAFPCSPDAIAAATDEDVVITSRRLRDVVKGGTVRTDLGDRPTRAVLPVAALDDVNDGSVVAFPLPVAQRLFARPDSIDTIYVLPTAGTDVDDLQRRLQHAVGTHNNVLRPEDLSVGVANILWLIPLLGMVSFFALSVGAVLIRNTMELSLAERRRDIAIASAVGGRPAQLARNLLLETATFGLLGGVLGGAVGLLVARPLLESMEEIYIKRVLGAELHIHAGWTPFVMGALLGVGVAAIAALGPIRRALRLDVASALANRDPVADPVRRPSPRQGLAVAGVAAACLGVTHTVARDGGLEPWHPSVAWPAFLIASVLLSVAVGSLAPTVMHALTRLGRRSAPLSLALANLVREPRRTSVMVGAAGAAVGMAFTIASFGGMLRDEIVQTRLGERGNAVRVITTPPNNDIDIDTKPSPQLIEALRAFPGVAGIEHGATIGVVTTDGYVGVSGGMGRFKRPYEILDGRADAEAFERGEVLIGPVLARERSLRGGGTLELPGRDGMARVRVQGVWANGDFNGSEITMPLWLLDDLWGPQPPEGLAVEPEPGVDPADLAARIRASGLDRHLIADAPADQLAAAASDLQGFFEPFWALQRALLLIAFAAVLFTLLLAAVQRRRELSLLAAVGMAPGSLARMILAEAAAVAVVGTVLGTVTALGVLVGFRDAFFLFVPYRVDLRPDMTVVPVYGAITLAILVLAAAWPAWQTTRLQPAQALRYE